jgi:hypothetical protein
LGEKLELSKEIELGGELESSEEIEPSERIELSRFCERSSGKKSEYGPSGVYIRADKKVRDPHHV